MRKLTTLLALLALATPALADTATTPTYTAADTHAFGGTLSTTGCTQETEWEIRTAAIASAPLIWTARSKVSRLSIGFVFGDRQTSGSRYARARCYTGGVPDTWSAFGTIALEDLVQDAASTVYNRGRNWIRDTFDRPDRDLDGTDDDGDGTDDGTKSIDEGSLLWDEEQAFSQLGPNARILSDELVVDQSGTYAYSVRELPADSFLVAKLAGYTGTDYDFVFQLRFQTSDGSYYQCKIEDPGDDLKWNAYDGNDYGAACGTTAHGRTFPFWVRCEVYKEGSDVRLRIYTAPDSGGTPGTWRLDVNTTHSTCAAGGWSLVGQTTAAGRVSIGAVKPGTHRVDDFAAGALYVNGGAQNRR